jgi:uncharacterized protein YgiM (DUF1202 family)
MKKILLFLVSVLLSVACGVTTTLNQQPVLRQPVRLAPAITVAQPQNIRQDATGTPRTPETRVVCHCTHVNLREGAGTRFGSLVVLSAGERVTLLEVDKVSTDGGSWELVKSDYGAGWVNADYLCEEK